MPVQLASSSSLNWRKSSASAGAGECVEVAISWQSELSRDPRAPAAPALAFTATQWLRLVRHNEADAEYERNTVELTRLYP